MKLYVYYEDTDTSCGDSECCGGPSPDPTIKVFSSLEKAQFHGFKIEDLKEVTIDDNELVHLTW